MNQYELIANEILDIYRENEDSSVLGDEQLKEIAELSGMKNPKIYQRLLSQLLSDIDNDAILILSKLKLLAAVLLQISGQPRNNTGQYCSGDDLYACLKLIVAKFDTILISGDNQNSSIFEMYDTLNVILTLMTQMNCDGLDEREGGAKDQIKKKIDNFTDTTGNKIRKALSMNSKEYGNNLSLKLKNAYANAALDRIKGTYKSEMARKDARDLNCILGCASLLKGVI